MLKNKFTHVKNAKVPVLGFSAYSGTGKTTLLTKLIPMLNLSGYQVGLIKHSHHRFEIDQPGKDSHTLRMAGATPVVLVSSHRRAVMTEFNNPGTPKLEDQLLAIDQSDLDLVLVEGFKAASFPKIEIHRPSLNKPLLFPQDSNIIAIATDIKFEAFQQYLKDNSQVSPSPYPLDLNNPEEISNFIIHEFLGAF